MTKAIDKIGAAIRSHFESQGEEKFVPGKTKIPLAIPQYGAEEVIESIESLLSTWVTMGKKVRKFESMFRDYVGAQGAMMVNSGSSANLLALSALSSRRFKDRIQPGDEVICPAVTWSTTIYPVLNIGAKPVLTDVGLESLNLTIESVEQAISPKTKAIMAVHLMGNPCEVDRLRKIADSKGIHLVEDACEAHGARIGNRHVGNFGICSTFSFFLSHHISTIEGGMLVSSDIDLLEIASAQRAHGWIREMLRSDEIAKQYPDIDRRFLFYDTGYNLRPTEIQGAFGIHQLPKLDKIVQVRRAIAKDWNKKLSQYRDFLVLPEERSGTVHSYFAYPVVVKPEAPFSRKEIMTFLESKMIETRPVAGGNLAEQPSAKLYDHRVAGSLDNSKAIMRNAFFIGVHTGIKKPQQEYVLECFAEFMSSKTYK